MKWEIPTQLHLLPCSLSLSLSVNAAIKLYVGLCFIPLHNAVVGRLVACGVWHVAYGWWCYAFLLVAPKIMLKEHCTLYRLTRQRITDALSYSPPLTPTSSTVAPGASTTLVPNAADSQQQQRRMLPPHHCRSHWEAAALPLGNSGRRPTNVLCCRHATVNGRREISS